jgi:aryl-alcohol dehydrogenase-like predicted oxidoreductase
MENRKPTYRKNKVPAELVLGTAGLGGVWGHIERRESVDTILYALENGIQRLDTAPAYNISEEIIGEALSEWNGKRPFVSTKVGMLKGETAHSNNHNFETKVMHSSVSLSMERLHCEKLDLLFLHAPELVFEEDVERVVDFMLELKNRKIVANIGFGGTPPKIYWPYIKKGGFDIVMGYNNLDACCLDGMFEDIPFLRGQGLSLYQGSPLHMGLLGNRFESYVQEAPEWITKEMVKNAIKIKGLADSAGISLPELAHRYILSVLEIDYLVLGSRNMKQLKNSLSDCNKGILEEDLFNKITKILI